MTTKNDRRLKLLETIRGNIKTHGYHLYAVLGGPSPRFAYTIGMYPLHGVELIFAGGAIFSMLEVRFVLARIRDDIRNGKGFEETQITLDGLEYKMRRAHSSWSSRLLLGALDYFEVDMLDAVQILPTGEFWTIDIPDMSLPWDSNTNSAWRWLDQDWNLKIPEKSMAVTNLKALKGQSITEVMRWEESEWEMFAGSGSEETEETIRRVPIWTLIGADQNLLPVIELDIGTGLWRNDAQSEWNDWK